VRAIVEGAPERLEPRGALAIEIGYGQAPAVARLFEAAGFTDVALRKDYGGIERVVSGVLP
jgi:release factor glutamine methyltransferase